MTASVAFTLCSGAAMGLCIACAEIGGEYPTERTAWRVAAILAAAVGAICTRLI